MGTSDIHALRRELVRKIRQVGLPATAAHIVRTILRRACSRVATVNRPGAFDARYGTDTAGVVGVGSLDVPEDQLEHSMRYGPIPDDEFIPTLEGFLLPYEELNFVDLGSGKGRALLLASLFPFRKIIGVELSLMLHDIARRNIQVFNDERQKCHDIIAVCENAATFELPQEPTLFYLANPFDDHVLRLVVANIQKSLHQHPRQVYVWYVHPDYRGPLDTAPFLRVRKEIGRSVFYESKPLSPGQ